MYETRSVTLTVRLPRDIADQAEAVQESDPDFLTRVMLYGLTRRSIYRHLRVRAKFRLNSYTTEMHMRSRGPRPTDGSPWPTEQVEKRTLNFTPVYPGPDASEQDRLFWDATPSGSLQLGVVNQEAWKHFELGKSYYLDFTPAE